MRLKTSYFNATQFRKNLTRFWPLWGGASLLGALAPLALLAMLMDAGVHNVDIQPLEVTLMYYQVVSFVLPAISLVYAVLCALAVWHYLYNARSVSLFHALPITRKGLFATNFLSGMAMMLLPYAVTGFLAVLISLATGCFEPVGVLVTVLCVAGESFFYFASATLVAFVTGNPFACAAFYFVFHFFAAGAESLVRILMNKFYFGVETYYQGVAEFLSPTIFLTRMLQPRGESEVIVTAGGWEDYGAYKSVTLENGWLIGVYALAGLALAACAWLLYQRRRSESAGEVVAAGWMKPIFRYGVAFCAGITGGVILYQIFFEWSQRGSTASGPKMAVCMALAGLVGYYIASMLLAKSLKIFRGTWKGALGTVIAAFVLCGAIVLDPAGVESWIPPLEEVESVGIQLYGEYGGSCSVLLEDPAAIQKVMELHQAIIDEKDLHQNHQGYYRQINISYNGENVRDDRFYSITCDANMQSNALALSEQLACDPVFQEANLFGYQDSRTARLTGGYVGQIYDTEEKVIASRDLSLEEAQALEDAIRRDIAAGHFGRTVFVTDYDEYQNTVIQNEIMLGYNITEITEEWGQRNYSHTNDIYISTYCTETIQALEDLGVIDGTHRLLTRQEYSDLHRSGDDDYGYPVDAPSYPEYEYVETAEVYG